MIQINARSWTINKYTVIIRGGLSLGVSSTTCTCICPIESFHIRHHAARLQEIVDKPAQGTAVGWQGQAVVIARGPTCAQGAKHDITQAPVPILARGFGSRNRTDLYSRSSWNVTRRGAEDPRAPVSHGSHTCHCHRFHRCHRCHPTDADAWPIEIDPTASRHLMLGRICWQLDLYLFTGSVSCPVLDMNCLPEIPFSGIQHPDTL